MLAVLSADLYDLCLRAGSLLIGVVKIIITMIIVIIDNIDIAGCLLIGVVNIIGCVIWMLSGAALVLAPKVRIRKSPCLSLLQRLKKEKVLCAKG